MILTPCPVPLKKDLKLKTNKMCAKWIENVALCVIFISTYKMKHNLCNLYDVLAQYDVIVIGVSNG